MKDISIKPDTNNGVRIISLQEAADYLNISYSTMRRMVLRGDIRAFHVGNIWRTSTAECEKFVEAQMREFEECLGKEK